MYWRFTNFAGTSELNNSNQKQKNKNWKTYCCIAMTTIHIYMQKHIQHNKDERTQFFRKIYLSLYSKGLCVRGELETEQRLQHIDPPTLLAITAFLSRSSGLINRGQRAQPLLDMVLIPASSLQLIWTSCHRGYIIIWHPPTSCERHNSHSIQPPVDSQGYPPISSTGCICYLHRCISHLTARPGQRSICNNIFATNFSYL